MLLYLMRHGHAEEHHPDGDAGRRLTSYGEQGVRRAAERLRDMGISFDRIIASPYARAMRTATITAGVIGYEGKILQDERLIPSGRFAGISDLAREHSDVESLLLTGHQPLIGEAAAMLTAEGRLRLAVTPGTVIVVEIAGFRPHAHGALLSMYGGE